MMVKGFSLSFEELNLLLTKKLWNKVLEMDYLSHYF